MKKHYWYERATYQDKISLAGILFWIILGTWVLWDSWEFNRQVQTPLLILPVNMIVLTWVYWYLQKKAIKNSRLDRHLLIFFGLIIISVSAFWVYEI